MLQMLRFYRSHRQILCLRSRSNKTTRIEAWISFSLRYRVVSQRRTVKGSWVSYQSYGYNCQQLDSLILYSTIMQKYHSAGRYNCLQERIPTVYPEMSTVGLLTGSCRLKQELYRPARRVTDFFVARSYCQQDRRVPFVALIYRRNCSRSSYRDFLFNSFSTQSSNTSRSSTSRCYSGAFYSYTPVRKAAYYYERTLGFGFFIFLEVWVRRRYYFMGSAEEQGEGVWWRNGRGILLRGVEHGIIFFRGIQFTDELAQLGIFCVQELLILHYPETIGLFVHILLLQDYQWPAFCFFYFSKLSSSLASAYLTQLRISGCPLGVFCFILRIKCFCLFFNFSIFVSPSSTCTVYCCLAFCFCGGGVVGSNTLLQNYILRLLAWSCSIQRGTQCCYSCWSCLLYWLRIRCLRQWATLRSE